MSNKIKGSKADILIPKWDYTFLLRVNAHLFILFCNEIDILFLSFKQDMSLQQGLRDLRREFSTIFCYFNFTSLWLCENT